MKNSFIPAILFLCLMTTFHCGAQEVHYSGTVTYHLEMSKNASGGGTDGGYNWNVSVDEKQIIEGRFLVTFTGKVLDNNQGLSGLALTDIQEDIQFVNYVNNEANEQKTSQACYDDRMVFRHNATPGDSRTEMLGVQWSRTDPGKAVIEGGTISFRNNKYYLMLAGKIKVDVSTEAYSEVSLPCLDTIIPPHSISSNSTLDFPIVIHAEKQFDNSRELSGSYVQKDESGDDCAKCLGGMGRMVHGDMSCSYVTNITTSWSLKKKCEALDKVGDELDRRKDISKAQKDRIKNVLAKLSDPSVDPYVFFSSGASNVLSISTEEQADIILNNKEKYMENLRKNLNKECESAKSIEELTNNIIRRDTWVVQFINRFNKDYLSEHRLSPGQVAIKDWIADQQLNPNSIYSCYGGK